MTRVVSVCLIAMGLALAVPLSSNGQGLPDSVRCAGLTRAQANELDRRLNALQSRLNALASQNELRETAVQNIAIEIFDARPDLDFESYVGLIEAGARQLRDYISLARQRVEENPSQAGLRERAISAAESGRLSDARRLYQDLIAANRDARRVARDAEDLADAADIAEAARLALISADYRGSAQLYSDAADLAPVGSRVRWLYRVMQTFAITGESAFTAGPHGMVVGGADPDAVVEAARILTSSAADAPADWQNTLENLRQSSSIDLELYLTAATTQAVMELYGPQ